MALTAVVVLLLVGLGGAYAAGRLAERDAIHSGANSVDLLADAVVQPVLTDAVVAGDPDALARLDAAVRTSVLPHDVVRVKLWTPEGRIVYADEPRLIGQVFPLGPDKRAALARPSTRALVTDGAASENEFERAMGPLMEAYRPVWTDTGRQLLFEVYSRYEPIAERAGQLWRAIAGLLTTSMVLFGVLLAPILWRLVRQLRTAATQREFLLHRAVTSSEEERRRLAGTLHDGPVQELVATSYKVSRAAQLAAADGREDLAAEIRDAVGTVRATVGSLRSLLVDLYPSSLARAGLAVALADLATSMTARGVPVDLQLDPAAVAQLDEGAERFAYRLVQETLRNTANHAQASRVEVVVRQAEGAVVVEVRDDGIGFDPAEVLATPEEGHFGLHVLRDLAAQVGADLAVASAGGRGTWWRATLSHQREDQV